MTENSQTSLTLLDAIRTGEDDLAWSTFYAKYSHRIVRWCRKWGITSVEADDLVQETVLSVYKSIGHFRYDSSKSFRSWLKTVARRVWLKLEEKSEFVSIPEELSGHAIISLELIRSDFLRQFEFMADSEIFEIACQRVQPRVDPLHWSAFLMTDYESIPGPVVASSLGMSLGSVHTATCRIRKLIREEINEIDPP